MKIGYALMASILALGLTPLGFAADETGVKDSSAMVGAVKSSKAAIIRVPIDDQGRELLSSAEMRLVQESVASSDQSTIPKVWENGLHVANTPTVDSSTSGDTSTHGYRYGWNPWYWGNAGWYAPNYYTGYWPSYYYNGYSYSYGSPYYYNYYSPSYVNNYPAWGHRYYYYPAAW